KTPFHLSENERRKRVINSNPGAVEFKKVSVRKWKRTTTLTRLSALLGQPREEKLT
ncbi:hypothetical protein AALP_AA4G051800, partial [Arabis alpina]